MAKNYTKQDLQAFEVGIENQDVIVANGFQSGCTQPKTQLDVTESATEGNQNLLEFPATKSAVAEHLQTTRQNLTKTWLKPLLNKGYEFYVGKKISKNGFHTLVQLMSEQKESGLNPKDFIASLPELIESTPEAQEEEIAETINTSAIEVLGQNNLDLTINLPENQSSEELIDLNALGIFGSEALTKAQEELVAQKQKLADTKVNLANSLLSMAKQAAMNQAAEETRKQLELELACEEAFQQELQRLQAIENARLQARQAHQKIKQNLGK